MNEILALSDPEGVDIPLNKLNENKLNKNKNVHLSFW